MAEVAAVRVSELPKKPGEFTLHETRKYLHFSCPCGCGAILGVSLKPEIADGWDWDGNVEKPTVHPSIEHLDGCRWHGYLTCGIFHTDLR